MYASIRRQIKHEIQKWLRIKLFVPVGIPSVSPSRMGQNPLFPYLGELITYKVGAL